MKTILSICAVFLLGNYFTACSVYMEATRPTPVDLNDYQEGMMRDAVLERLGAPDNTAVESDGASCDFYKLYTHGYGAGGKIPIAVVEGAADVVTLGLAEIVLTPTEGVTKNEKHPVTFCYKAQKLARITGDGQPTASASEIPPITPASTATSGVLPSTTPSAAAAIASDQPKSNSQSAAPVAANSAPLTSNPAQVTANAAPISANPAPAVVPAAAVITPAPAAANPQVGDQWKSSDHDQ
jgi:hypothetical protein